jgi:alpha-glucoside transport system substrate-binding protein
VSLVSASCTLSGGDEPDELSVFGPWLGADATALRKVLEGFTGATGIEVRYTGSSSFPDRIEERSTEGDVPDVALFPQMGLLRQLTSRGIIQPLPDDVRGIVEDSYNKSIADTAGAADIEGVLVKASVKSLVWYRPDVFEEYGYSIPATWADLTSLTEQIADDGFAPWCIGIGAFGATGWPATDWVEDILLRFSGPEVYDDWVRGALPFTDAEIGAAIQGFGSLVFDIREPIGGRSGVVDTPQQRAQDPAFEDPPRCVLHRQASFHLSNLPDGTDVGPEGDVDVFILPGLDDGSAPLLIGGDAAAAMTDRPETWALMSYLASEDAAGIWAEQGATVSPSRFIGPDGYPEDFDRRMSMLIDDADVVRFDASDLMPPSVGTDSFLRGMVAYVARSDVAAAQDIAQSGWEDTR